MKAKAIIHLMPAGNQVRTAQGLIEVIKRLDDLPQGGTLKVDRVTDHGTVKTCFIPAGAITRFEEA